MGFKSMDSIEILSKRMFQNVREKCSMRGKMFLLLNHKRRHHCIFNEISIKITCAIVSRLESKIFWFWLFLFY